MSCNTNLNVYSGPDSVKNYYDPEVAPPLPLVEIPQSLNPFYEDGVHIYAKMMTMLPAHNVKALPALALLSSPEVVTNKTKTIIEYSSGSTVISMSLIARILHGITDTRAYLSNKTSGAKLRLMQFFGLDVTLFGGPSQPEPIDPRGGIQQAYEASKTDDTIANPNQYENEDNWRAHYRWTGPQLHAQLPNMSVVCAGLGTSGTMTGIGTAMKELNPSVRRLAVCTAPGERVPGPRTHAMMAPVKFPWRAAIDDLSEVGAVDAFATSLSLTREGIVCGPSSGLNLFGLHKFLTKHKDAGTLDDLRNSEGEIVCAFICCDLPYQYVDEYFDRLPSSHFHPIHNKELAEVDLYRYDEAWELSPDEVIQQLCKLPLGASENHTDAVLVLDLRNATSFAAGNLEASINIPLQSLDPNSRSPFFSPQILEKQWRELHDIFGPKNAAALRTAGLMGRRVLVTCYDGDTSRMACSILRASGVQSWSVRGGVDVLLDSIDAAKWRENVLQVPLDQSNSLVAHFAPPLRASVT